MEKSNKNVGDNVYMSGVSFVITKKYIDEERGINSECINMVHLYNDHKDRPRKLELNGVSPFSVTSTK